MIYYQQLKALSYLDGETFKRMMMAFGEYSRSGRTPEGLEGADMGMFEMYRERLDHDSMRYDQRVSAASLGGKRKAELARIERQEDETRENTDSAGGCRSLPNAAEACRTLPTTPTSTPTTTPTTTSTSTATSSSSPGVSLPSDPPEIIAAAPKKEEEVFPPTREMIISYLREKGWDADAEEFLTRCREAEWKDGNGQPVKNWRLWLKGFIMKHPAESAAGRCAPDPRIAALERLKRKYREEAGNE